MEMYDVSILLLYSRCIFQPSFLTDWRAGRADVISIGRILMELDRSCGRGRDWRRVPDDRPKSSARHCTSSRRTSFQSRLSIKGTLPPWYPDGVMNCHCGRWWNLQPFRMRRGLYSKKLDSNFNRMDEIVWEHRVCRPLWLQHKGRNVLESFNQFFVFMFWYIKMIQVILNR